MKTREQIQSEALEAIKTNNYNCVIGIDPGSGKSKVAIDCIKQGNFKNILITSPRTNLKKNWRLELEKWGIEYNGGNWLYYDTFKSEYPIFLNIILENIQTCYKWSWERLRQFDFIIYDEIHTCGQEYFNSVQVDIPILGLTGTPTKSDPWKKEVLYKTLPIVYEYYNAEDDGVTNKIKYWIYEYQLTDDFKVQVGTKTKTWKAGELTQYNYLSEQYEKAKNLMFLQGAKEYFETSLLWMKGKQLALLNKDGYPTLVEIDATKEQREAGRKFFFAVRNRKEFLWNLTSSKLIALKFKENILNKKYYDEELYCIQNKVLLFSELTEQANKLSKYALHSNNGDTPKQIEENNKKLLEDFNNGVCRELSSCMSLMLGLNMVGANWAIFESYSSSNTKAIQKCKRLVRLGVDEVANVVIILPKGTQAETWFNEAFKGIDYQVINKISDLKV
jgi:superfamily II DNA or RNA helicase